MSLDDFEFKRQVYLGERVSIKHPFFQEISKLGFEEAENYADLEILKGFFPDWEEILEGFKAITELHGMATFLRKTKEITRLSLALGKTKRRISAKSEG